ncbi:hypothetical protein GCM10009424_21300 [Sphingomonas ursincola]
MQENNSRVAQSQIADIGNAAIAAAVIDNDDLYLDIGLRQRRLNGRSQMGQAIKACYCETDFNRPLYHGSLLGQGFDG